MTNPERGSYECFLFQVAAICVLPNEVVIPLAPNVDVTRLYFPEPDVSIHSCGNEESRPIAGRDSIENHRGEEPRESRHLTFQEGKE